MSFLDYVESSHRLESGSGLFGLWNWKRLVPSNCRVQRQGQKGRVLDRPIESRSRILSYSTVISASSAGFGSFGTAGRRVGVEEIQR